MGTCKKRGHTSTLQVPIGSFVRQDKSLKFLCEGGSLLYLLL